ncbi:hypothetical protein BRC75_08355 [Halobacteriales archaeon QH_7_69_31]|nr:MAG: hypothetical protein BRC75_08355 [Halobacteriales archaeon QH_7_69_31]
MSSEPPPDKSPDEAGPDDATAGPSTPSTEAPAGSPADDSEPGEWVPFEGLSQEGLLLLFAGLACGMASLTALSRGQPQPVVVFGAVTGVVALAVFAVDLLTGLVPDIRVHMGVGAGASVAGAFALAGSHWVNAGTFAIAAALVLYRVVDVEYRGAD